MPTDTSGQPPRVTAAAAAARTVPVRARRPGAAMTRPYRSGWCSSGTPWGHRRCSGVYGGARCACPCHSHDPQPPPHQKDDSYE